MIFFVFAIIAYAIFALCQFYRYLKKTFSFFGADITSRGIKATLIAFSALLTAGSINMMSTVSIVLLHLLFLELFITLISSVIKFLTKKEFVFWDKLYRSGTLPVIMTAIIIMGGYFNMHNVVRTDYTVYTDKQIRSEGYRIAFIADVHFGVSLELDEFKEKCVEISRLKPDIVVLGGDIADDATSKADMNAVFEALGRIDSRYGVFYIFGNHDRPMSFVKSEYTEAELISAISQNGITILKDESFIINDELCLIGRDDLSIERWGKGRMSVGELISDKDKKDFILMLDHQPNQYFENAAEGVDLILSGHTHGGQIWPANLIQKIFNINDAVYGPVHVDNDTEAIVTSGFAGWKYPIKTSAPSEYVMINLKNR